MNARLLGVLAGAVVLTGCTAAPAPDAAPVTTEPPAPPAACLLDVDALTAASGVAWTPDEIAASDTRCVYDADGGGEFLVVEITASVPLDEVAAVCTSGSRAPAGGGFVCGLPGGGVFAATERDGDLLTLATATVPAATTSERLATALGGQLG